MAQLLVHLINNAGNGGYKKGDIVSVQEDSHVWGNKETLPRFGVVVITGATVEQILPYCEPEYILANITNGMAKRRLWSLLVDNVPSNIKTQIMTIGTVTVSKSQIKAFLRNKVTDAEADLG